MTMPPGVKEAGIRTRTNEKTRCDLDGIGGADGGTGVKERMDFPRSGARRSFLSLDARL